LPFDFQVAFDCADAHKLADWWAETLGWVVEEQDPDFIRRMIAEGYATEADTTMHNGRLVWRDGAAIRHPDWPASGQRKRVIFQVVPEPKSVKNRVHLDVWVGEEHVSEQADRLIARGATFVHKGSQGPHESVTLTDPEGNEFCLG
jgi:catechol 2,3-dioxygenase-like lactoylglutathione lyase family enzyme